MKYQVMDIDGIYVSPVTAEESEEAIRIVQNQGYEVLDVMDDMVIIAPGA